MFSKISIAYATSLRGFNACATLETICQIFMMFFKFLPFLHQQKRSVSSHHRTNNIVPEFYWSLKPFNSCMKFVMGLDLSVSNKKHKPFSTRLILPIIGIFIIILYLAVNGPCGFFSYRVKYDINKKMVDENPFEIAPEKQDEFAELLRDFCRIPLFLSTPIIHLFFMGNVLLTRNWKDLCFVLLKIQKEMKLDEKFHQKCRHHCLVAIGLLLMVILIILASINI